MKKKLESGLNKKLLRKISKHILAHPKNLDMGVFYDVEPVKGKNMCGTIACVAGWAVALGAKGYDVELEHKIKRINAFDPELHPEELSNEISSIDFEDDARQILGLTDNQAEYLFHVGNWPEEFAVKYNAAYRKGRLAEAAKITVARIEHLIKHGE